MKSWVSRSITMLVLGTAWIIFSTAAKADDWKFSVTPYFWASDIKLDAKVNGNTVLAADVDVSDLLDKLDIGFAAHVEAYTDKGGFFVDGNWNSLSSKDERSGGGLLAGTKIHTDLSIGTYELGAFYHPTKPGNGFDVLFGVRLLDVNQDIKFELPTGDSTRSETQKSYTDAFVGIRAGGPLGGPWDLMVRGDVGTGDTDFTWNALGTVGFTFGSKSQFGARIGWKETSIHLEDTGTETSTESDIVLKGPIAGFTIAF